jgi:hypothetical protein
MSGRKRQRPRSGVGDADLDAAVSAMLRNAEGPSQVAQERRDVAAAVAASLRSSGHAAKKAKLGSAKKIKLGCAKCRFAKGGCGVCRATPTAVVQRQAPAPAPAPVQPPAPARAPGQPAAAVAASSRQSVQPATAIGSASSAVASSAQPTAVKSEWPEESELRAANGQLRSWLDEAHAKLARAEEAADAETAQLKVTIARHQRQHHEQGTKLDELTRQVAGFSQQVASLTAAKEQAEKETRLLTTEAASLSEQLAQLTAAATRHRQREADQASMISSLTEQLELAEARHARDAAKPTELDAANEQLASVTKRLGDAAELNAHLGQQLTAHDRSTHAVHADLAARDEQLAEANERERRLIDEQRRLLSRWAAVDRPSARSLAQSRFCETYSKCARVPREVGVLHDALVQVVCDYAARHSIGAHSRDHFLERMDASTGLRDDVHQSDTALPVLKRFVTRMWTASRKLNGVECARHGMASNAR